jgi:asparagine synthase (glutamine-hydrolysing)
MSGICGIYEQGRPFAAELIAPMLNALALPGESERGACGGTGAALGVARRWKFQQAARFAGISVVTDADLVGRGAVLHALSFPATSEINVAELLARLYVQQGMDFLKELHGAFSLALWDEQAQRLILAIDRLGIRNLYWRRENSRILFASQPSGVRSLQSQPPTVNPRAILQYLLFSSIPAPLAIDVGLERLRPGTFVSFQSGRAEEHQYWDLQYPQNEKWSAARWARELREQMRSSIHRHLEDCEDTRTGCYLSGGTDSSSVVAFSSERHTPTQTFSIAFQETGFSEIEFARTAAKRFHTRHYEKWVTPQDAWAALEKVISYYDEPFANSSAIGSYYCALLAQEHGVDVLLAGDGGDELFGGNERYARDKYFSLYHSVPQWLRRIVIEPAVRLLPETGAVSLPRKYVRRANLANPRRIFSYGFFLSTTAEEIFNDEFLMEVGKEDWLAIAEAHFHRPSSTSELNRILYLDAKMTLADNDLRKVSGTAELAGVNVRYPLLDDRLVEFAGRIPSALKLKGFQKRYIFKRAMQGILPDKILYKKKHGFGVPLAQWLLNEPHMKALTYDVLHDPQTRQRGYFRPEFFDRLTTLHQQQPNYYGEIVWYLVALELWHRKHFDRSRDSVHVA